MGKDYEALGISRKATGPEVSEAFRRRVVKKNADFGASGMLPAEARGKSEELREAIEARNAIMKRRERLVSGVTAEIRARDATGRRRELTAAILRKIGELNKE